jgi:hypothetical protein
LSRNQQVFDPGYLAEALSQPGPLLCHEKSAEKSGDYLEAAALFQRPLSPLTPSLKLTLPRLLDLTSKGRHCLIIRRYPIVVVVPTEHAA